MATLASSQGLTSMPAFSGARPSSWRASMSAQTLGRPLSIQPFASGLNPSRPMSMQPFASGVNHTRPLSFQPFATTVNQARPQSGPVFDPAELCLRLKMHERHQKDQEEMKRIRASQIIEEEEELEDGPQFDSIDFARTSTVPDGSSGAGVHRLSMLEEESVGPDCEPSSSRGDCKLQRAQHIESAAAQLEGPSVTSSLRRTNNVGRHTTVDFSSLASQARRPISHAPTGRGQGRPFGKGHARSLSTGDASRGTNIAEVIEREHQAAEAAKKPRFSYMCEEGYDWNQGEGVDESMKMYPSRTKRNSKFKELFVPPSVWFVNRSSSTIASPTASSTSATAAAAPTQGMRGEVPSNTLSPATSPTNNVTLTENKKPAKVRFDPNIDPSAGSETPRKQRKRKSAFFFQRPSFSSSSSSASPASHRPPAPPPPPVVASTAAVPATTGTEGKEASKSNNQRKRKSSFLRDLFRRSEGGKKWRWR